MDIKKVNKSIDSYLKLSKEEKVAFIELIFKRPDSLEQAIADAKELDESERLELIETLIVNEDLKVEIV